MVLVGGCVVAAGAMGACEQRRTSTLDPFSTVESHSTVGEIVGQESQALTVNQTTIDNQAGQILTETSATQFTTSGGTHEIVNASNSNGGSNRFDYACTANNYSSWCPNVMSLGSGQTGVNGDVGLAANGGATPRVYGVALSVAQDGYWFIRSTDPCPGAGVCQSATWETSRHVVANPTFVDLPQVLTSPTTGDVFILSRGNTGMLVAKFGYSQT